MIYESIEKENGQLADFFHLGYWVNYFSITVTWNHLSAWNKAFLNGYNGGYFYFDEIQWNR